MPNIKLLYQLVFKLSSSGSFEFSLIILSRRLFFLIFFVFIAQNKPIFGQNLNPSELINQQDWLIRNQQNQFEEQRKKREFNKIEKEQELIKEEEKSKKPQTPKDQLTECSTVERARIEGSKLLSNRQKKKLLEDLFCNCINGQKIYEIASKISKTYHESGFVTSHATIPPQNIADGELILKVLEGKIENITLGKDGLRQELQKFFAFGPYKNKALNLNDLNQGIAQMNRLSSNQALLKIEPGSEAGKSRVVIENPSNFPISFSASHNNLGNKFSGVYKSSFSSNIDNLLSLNDSLNLNYSANLVDDNHVKDNRAFSLSYSIPYRYNTITYDYSYSDYSVHLPINNKDLNFFSGYSQQSKITLDRLFLNSKNLRIAGFASLTDKSAASYQNFKKYSDSQRNLSIADFGLSAFLNRGNSSLYIRPSIAKGLKILNAQKDSPDMKNSQPKSQFEVFKLYGSVSSKINLPKLDLPISLVSEINGQIARQNLYGSEEFGVGGYYSVRGFRESFISGDSGYSFRNKISFNLGSVVNSIAKIKDFAAKNSIEESKKEVLSPKIPAQIAEADPNKKSNFRSKFADLGNLASKTIPSLNQFYFEPFFDYGHAQYQYEKIGGRLAGTGFKLSFNGKYISASLTQSWAVSKSKLINTPQKENSLLYFELSAKCC